MRSSLSKHWAGRAGNSPLKQKKAKGEPPKFGLNLNADKNRQSVGGDLSYNKKGLSAGLSGEYSKGGNSFNATTGYNSKNNKFSAGVEVGKNPMEGSNVKARVGFKF
jgi:hypothetical protein